MFHFYGKKKASSFTAEKKALQHLSGLQKLWLKKKAASAFN